MLSCFGRSADLSYFIMCHQTVLWTLCKHRQGTLYESDQPDAWLYDDSALLLSGLEHLIEVFSYKLHLERSSHPFKVFCIWVGSRGECTHTRTWAFMLRMSNACTCSAGKFTSIHFTGTPRGSAADPGPLHMQPRLPVLESPWLGMHCPACLPTEKGLLICIIESALEVSRHTCSCHAPLRHRSFCCARDADTEQRCVHSLCSRHML